MNTKKELLKKIWNIANNVRGMIDGWDFRQYFLYILFYRFISEDFIRYMEGGEESIKYAELPREVISPELKHDTIKSKGYFIYPDQLFVNVAKDAENKNLTADLSAIFMAIENSATGYHSEKSMKGIFSDFDTKSSRLGNTVEEKNTRLASVLSGIDKINFIEFYKNETDIFGDAYEFLISNYSANGGRSGGEFFTPQHVSKLIAQLAMHKQTSVNKIYDPACGSGSLLLQFKKHFHAHGVVKFFGQELNHTTYNLARINMILRNINFTQFNIKLGNTLTRPHFGNYKPFDIVVCNPPYSMRWIGSDDPSLINDDRFAGLSVPKSKADYAFVLHVLNYLSDTGRAVIVCPPGMLYRGGVERKIRKYLVDNNYVESIISLPSNLFYSTTISVNLLVLSKNKSDRNIYFIDASGEEFFDKELNKNIITDNHIKKIVNIFENKINISEVALIEPLESVIGNNYNLLVKTYIRPSHARVMGDIKQINKEIKSSVIKIEQLRTKIDNIIADFES